ncbi:MAG: SAM-dependent methyltransferase [Eubacterium sp.]|nr:SAM-dependent methyltransferase [Eubacterium sp.]
MQKVKQLLMDHLNEDMLRAAVSNGRKKQLPRKIVFRPFLERGHLMFQREEYRGQQVFHKNMDKETAVEQICAYLKEDYKQLDLQCQNRSFSVLVSKKGKSSIKEQRQTSVKKIELSHNRRKQYILEAGQMVPFLVDLGVQTADGRIVDKKYKKYKQINRFMEFIRDVLPELRQRQSSGKPLKIIDFGCGKSYLTFAVYYYLRIMQGIEVEMTGLDLKQDVIVRCNDLAKKYGYENLHFSQGDIGSYEGADQVDLVITLHACDTATDLALDKAVCWGAEVILSVPCCQHELNGQIRSELLSPILRYGILKERFAALLTDALRAELLEQMGYEVQILEFIDMEHTPKNLLIRAVKKKIPDGSGSCQNGAKRSLRQEQYNQLCDALNSHGTLEQLLEPYKRK